MCDSGEGRLQWRSFGWWKWMAEQVEDCWLQQLPPMVPTSSSACWRVTRLYFFCWYEIAYFPRMFLLTSCAIMNVIIVFLSFPNIWPSAGLPHALSGISLHMADCISLAMKRTSWTCHCDQQFKDLGNSGRCFRDWKERSSSSVPRHAFRTEGARCIVAIVPMPNEHFKSGPNQCFSLVS